MGDRLANITDELVAACRAGVAEAAESLSRALGGEFVLTVAEPSAFNLEKPPTELAGPGLAMLIRCGDEGLALLAPATAGWLPPWCASPDATCHSKLQTLAQELSVTLAPDSLSADETTTGWVADLGEALRASRPSEASGLITFTATAGEHSAPLWLVWPLAAPQQLLGAEPAAPKRAAPRGAKRDLSTLPAYARSLLKIRVPVSVQLATRKETVQEIVGLAPGAIVKFDKGCDELLQMVVGGNAVAEGEAVKIGDKFGFRITSMLMPQEHFVKVKRPQAG
jgi:flagellar motor switch protein FliN/FliY